ncbi:MAG: ABC transporter permease [Treponema sp.]|jgi:ABC-type polysaccharide/polyol phosphate export permease|nr:ABC transporter permease [Treponema sp.]
MAFTAILWREWLAFKSKWLSITLSSLTGPVLYITAFGWGLGSALTVDGMPYISFVIPGIIAMNSMTSGFSVIAVDINMARSYQKTFESVMISPAPVPAYVIARISANVLRCLYASLLILAAARCFGAAPRVDAYFCIVLILNASIFSTAGFLAGILIDSHADIAKLSSFVITPMSFLCGTFFPLEKFPPILRSIAAQLPLARTTTALRSGCASDPYLANPLILALWFAALLSCAVCFCRKAE